MVWLYLGNTSSPYQQVGFFYAHREDKVKMQQRIELIVTAVTDKRRGAHEIKP